MPAEDLVEASVPHQDLLGTAGLVTCLAISKGLLGQVSLEGIGGYSEHRNRNPGDVMRPKAEWSSVKTAPS